MAGVEEAVRAAVAAVPQVDKRDQGAVELAYAYARALDTGSELEKVGPLLLACLEALRLTPRARAAAVKGGSDGRPGAGKLDELRERRARKSGTAAVDAASS